MYCSAAGLRFIELLELLELLGLLGLLEFIELISAAVLTFQAMSNKG